VICSATHWYEVVGAIGSGVGGLGAAVGAGAAWRAARDSRATSRDALDALSYAIAPTVLVETIAVPEASGEARSPWVVRIDNTSSFAAADVTVDVVFADGHQADRRWERVPPGDRVELEMRKIDTPPGGPKKEEAGERLVLRYSDERRIARYEERFGFMFRNHPGYGRVELTSVMSLGDPQRVASA
jgi:hypothetical protein